MKLRGGHVNSKIEAAAALALMTLLFVCGCAGVEPWDRDVLARPDMQIVSDPSEAAADEHIYFSKEASSGGQGFGGGGCGCN
jgi:hypothetical protein